MQILNALNILGLHALFIHQIPVIGNIFINVLDLLDQLFGLELPHFLHRHGFDFLLIVILCHFDHPFSIFQNFGV